MPGRFTDVRRFVDDIAGVDDDLESTEEFSDGEIDIWEEQNLERMCALNDRVTAANLLLGTLHSAVPPRPEGFEISEALEVEDVLKIVERCRRRAQVSPTNTEILHSRSRSRGPFIQGSSGRAARLGRLVYVWRILQSTSFCFFHGYSGLMFRRKGKNKKSSGDS